MKKVGKNKKIYSITMKAKLIWLGISFFLIAATAAYLYISITYTITEILVEGNAHYTDEEIQEIVMTKPYDYISLFLAVKYKNKEIKGVPFVETMDVSVISPHTIKIRVYEKALAGYISYLDRYMYFDKDGIIVESSTMKTGSIPQVTGLEFGYVRLYEKLPVENETIFKEILMITQLLNKYGILADKIYFDNAYEMTLYFAESRVNLGNSDYLEEKILKLKSILPDLEGKKGVLRMENYSDDSKYLSFQLD